jgi:circadian clock protein KaiC
VLVSGSPGTGKTSVAAAFLLAACRRGERAMLFAYEESSAQVIRNMRSIGLDLAPWVAKGLLRILASRPTLRGLEQHLVLMHEAITEFEPRAVVVDPISNLSLDRGQTDVKAALMRLIDFLKQRDVTALFTSLTSVDASSIEDSEIGVSSLMDSWLLLRNVEDNGERNRLIYVLKSRGMAHSNQVREFVLSDAGIDLIEVAFGADRVLIGTARAAHERLERSATARRAEDHDSLLRKLGGKQRAIAAQIGLLQAEAAEVQVALAREGVQAKTPAASRGNGRLTPRRIREKR